jgi:hypothetical protein
LVRRDSEADQSIRHRQAIDHVDPDLSADSLAERLAL